MTADAPAKPAKPKKPPPRGIWRVLRWIRRLGVIALVTTLLVAGAAVALVNTDWGRNLLRREIEHALRAQFPGGAKIGRLEGSVFNTLTAFDVELDGRDGKPMVTIGALTIDAALRPLATHHVEVNSIVIDGLAVDLHPQPPDPNAKPVAPPKSPHAEDGEPSAWAVDVDRVELHDARIAYTPATGDAIHIDHLDLYATASMPAPEPGARAAPPITGAVWTKGTWRERGPFEVSASAAFDRAHDEASLPLLAAAFAGASATGLGLRVNFGAVPRVAGVLALHASRATLTAFGVPPDTALPGDGAIDAVVDLAPRGNIAQIAFAATAGAAQVHGDLTADLVARTAHGIVRADETDLGALAYTQVDGSAHVVAAVEASETFAHGVLSVTEEVDVAPPMRALLAVEATLAQQTITAGISGPDDARASLLAEITRAGDAFTLTRGRAWVRARDPARASGGRAPVHGAVAIDANAHGALWPATKLVVDVDASASNLAYNALGAKALRVHVGANATRTFSEAGIHIDVVAPHSGSTAVADASFDLYATAAPTEPVPLRVNLDKHQVRTLAGIVFAGGGGRVAVTRDRIDVRGLQTGVGASRVTASGTFLPKTADFSAKLDITELAFASLLPDLSGTAAGSIDIARRGGRWSGGGGLRAHQLVAVAGKPPVDADLRVDIAGTHVTAHGTAESADIFATRFDVDLDGPRDPTDVAAWEKLPRSALHSLQVEVTKLEVDAALVAAGQDPALLPVHGGAVTGTVTLTDAGAAGELDVTGVQAPSGEVGATIAFAHGDPAEIATTVTVTGAGVGTASLAAHAAVPVHLFAPGEWAALDRHALRGAVATLADQPFDPALFAKFGVAVPYRGRAELTLTADTGATTTKLVADVHAVTGGGIEKPVGVHAVVTLDAAGLVAQVTGFASGLPLFAAQATSPLTIDRVVAGRVAAVRAAAVTGAFAISKLDLPTALATLGRSDITAGTLDGSIAFGGTLGLPTATGTLAATDVTVVPGLGGKPLPRLDDLKLDVRWTGIAGSLDAVAHESNGGVLTAHAQGGLADPAATTFELSATGLDIAPLAAFAPDPYVAAAGTLDAQLHLRGLDLHTGALSGQIHIAKGRFPLSPKVGTLRQLDATIKVDGQSLGITANALLGPGDVQVSGTVALVGAAPSTADLKVHVHKINLIGAVQPVINGDVDLKLAYKDAQWTGKVSVTKASVNLPTTSSGNKLLAMGEPGDMEFVDAPPPPPKTIHLDAPENPWLVVDVDVAPTEVVADEIRAVVKAKDLKLSYGDEIGLDGDIDMDRGDIELFGRRYQVELALLVFDGGTDPVLNVSISYAFPDVTTYTDIGGRLSEPVLNLHADPSLYTQGQLLGFLLGGDPGGDPSSQARDEAATVGASVASAFLSQKLNKVLPVKVTLRCNPSTSSASAMCTAGKWVNDKLYVGYQQHLDPLPEENTGEIDLQYYLFNHVIIDFAGGDRTDGLDLLWRKRW